MYRGDDDPFGLFINTEPKHSNSGVIVTGIQQGSQEWLDLRAGKISSSRIAHMMAKGKDGLTRKKYLNQLAIERITGIPITGSFKSKSMMKGNSDEPIARAHYEFETDVDAESVTFVHHPFITNAGASPDSMIGDFGLLEIKCPDLTTHIEYIKSKTIPGDYQLQMQWQLSCTGRQWCDWMSYAKEMPPKLRALIIRVFRDEKKIKQIEDEAERFNQEIEQLITQLERG